MIIRAHGLLLVGSVISNAKKVDPAGPWTDREWREISSGTWIMRIFFYNEQGSIWTNCSDNIQISLNEQLRPSHPRAFSFQISAYVLYISYLILLLSFLSHSKIQSCSFKMPRHKSRSFKRVGQGRIDEHFALRWKLSSLCGTSLHAE